MFDPFAWASGVLQSPNELKRVAFATLLVFGVLQLASDNGLPMAGMVAALVAVGVLLRRMAPDGAAPYAGR